MYGVKARSGDPDLRRVREVELLVDTGAVYTVLPRSLLEELGIEPMGKRKFRTIEGKIIERYIGEAVIECLGERATCIVVFAEENDFEVLGVTALENLALEIDPVTKQLRKAEAVPALASLSYEYQ